MTQTKDSSTYNTLYTYFLVCAAKSSAGELEKTKSRLRIPQRPRLCPLQPRGGGRLDGFKPAPTDHIYVSPSGGFNASSPPVITDQIHVSGADRGPRAHSTCWRLNRPPKNRPACAADCDIRNDSRGLSEVVKFTGDRWCAYMHVFLCASWCAVRDLLCPCVTEAQRR